MKTDSAIFEKARALLDKAEKVIITNHLNPDGDAMGSALGLARILQSSGRRVKVIVPNEYPDFLKWMAGHEEVMIYEADPTAGAKIIEDCDLIFILDYNALKRSGSMQEVLGSAKAKKIVIDHHQQPEDFADLLYSDAGMSSTAEMVYHFIEATGLLAHLDTPVAEALYAGIITDTGNFRYSATTARTHQVASALLEAGVAPQIISSRVYDSNRPERFKLLARMLGQMEIIEKQSTIILCLTEKDLSDFHYQKGDTEGFVNYGLSVDGIELSIFAYPSHDKVKMSFRSKSNFDVNLFARKHFNGGGHKNAAGGVSQEPLDKVVNKIREILPAYGDQLREK